MLKCRGPQVDQEGDQNEDKCFAGFVFENSQNDLGANTGHDGEEEDQEQEIAACIQGLHNG